MKSLTIFVPVLLISVILIHGVVARSSDKKTDEGALQAAGADTRLIQQDNTLRDLPRAKRRISFPKLPKFPKVTPEIIQTTASAIEAGASLAGTTVDALMNTGHSVEVGMEIDNYSKWLLYDPHTYPHAGYISVPASHVQSGTKEAMVAHKGPWPAATGTYGTVSWIVHTDTKARRKRSSWFPSGNWWSKIGPITPITTTTPSPPPEPKKRVIVMWSAPYNFNHYSNWLAVGIIPEGDDGRHQFDKMYYDESGPFTRGEYYWDSKRIEYCDKDMCIDGIMGTGHKTTIRITFYPKDGENLAEGVKAIL